MALSACTDHADRLPVGWPQQASLNETSESGWEWPQTRAWVRSSTIPSEQAPPHSHSGPVGGGGEGFGAGGGSGGGGAGGRVGFVQCGQPSHLPQKDSRHQASVAPNRTAEHSGAELLYGPMLPRCDH